MMRPHLWNPLSAPYLLNHTFIQRMSTTSKSVQYGINIADHPLKPTDEELKAVVAACGTIVKPKLFTCSSCLAFDGDTIIGEYGDVWFVVTPSMRPLGDCNLSWTAKEHTIQNPVLKVPSYRAHPQTASLPYHAHGHLTGRQNTTTRNGISHIYLPPFITTRIIDEQRYMEYAAINRRKRGGPEPFLLLDCVLCPRCDAALFGNRSDFCLACDALTWITYDEPYADHKVIQSSRKYVYRPTRPVLAPPTISDSMDLLNSCAITKTPEPKFEGSLNRLLSWSDNSPVLETYLPFCRVGRLIDEAIRERPTHKWIITANLTQSQSQSQSIAKNRSIINLHSLGAEPCPAADVNIEIALIFNCLHEPAVQRLIPLFFCRERADIVIGIDLSPSIPKPLQETSGAFWPQAPWFSSILAEGCGMFGLDVVILARLRLLNAVTQVAANKVDDLVINSGKIEVDSRITLI